MAWTLVEGLIDAVQDYLQDNLAAKLDAIDTEINDGIVLEDIVDWYVSEKSLSSVQSYPSLFILAQDSSLVSWNNTHVDGGHRVSVSVLMLDQDSERLGRKKYRYVRAIWECLVDAHFASELSSFIILGEPDVQYSPSFITDASEYVTEASVVFIARKQESR